MANILSQDFLCKVVLGMVPLAIVSSVSVDSVHAKDMKANSTCLLQIDGTTYLDGPCYFENNSRGDFFWDPNLEIRCRDGRDPRASPSCSSAEQRVTKPGVFGFLNRDGVPASLCWNELRMIKASPCFLGLERSGACWSAAKAQHKYDRFKSYSVKFCAWKD